MYMHRSSYDSHIEWPWSDLPMTHKNVIYSCIPSDITLYWLNKDAYYQEINRYLTLKMWESGNWGVKKCGKLKLGGQKCGKWKLGGQRLWKVEIGGADTPPPPLLIALKNNRRLIFCRIVLRKILIGKATSIRLTQSKQENRKWV